MASFSLTISRILFRGLAPDLLKTKSDVFPHSHRIKKRAALKDIGKLLFETSGEIIFPHAGDVLAVDHDAPRVGLQEPQHQL